MIMWLMDMFSGTDKVQDEPLVPVEEKDSFIKFHISDDLSVKLETVINDKTLESMIKSEYLTPIDAETEEVVHIAAVVLAQDIIEQIIADVEGR